jgi:hypothetical protein
MGNLTVRFLCGTTTLLAGLVLALLMIPSEAGATGTGCGVFTSCPHGHDYCRFVSITSSICTERGDGAESCTGLGQGTCKSGLVCDFLQGECRHEPGQTGELCSIFLPCTSSLACTSGRCGPRRGPRQSCTGLGQGTCQAGLLCDFLGECRHVPGEFGEFCGAGVPCIDSLGCSADVGGRCEERDTAGEVCSGIGQGSCQAGLVCDFDRTCRHDPPQLGEPCGTGVPCIASLGCSAEIAGVCEERDSAGETCSGIGQGSCEAGLVCDFLRVCRHTPPQVNEPCGIGVECVAGLFCQGITQVCKVLKTAGEGCSAFNPCRAGLSCDLCLTETCNHPGGQGHQHRHDLRRR